MPSLFNRRSRSVSTTRPPPAASSSAHLAAAQAFRATQPQNGSLSSAAAAAALRSMSPPPTPVNQVQTKRMLNRQSSISSVGSAARGRSRGGLQRQQSNGSMTDRTFRSPSPGQRNTVNPVVNSKAPPVPQLPQQFVEDVPPIPKKSHRRSMSLEDFSSRSALSPPPRPAGRTQAVARAPPPVMSAAATAARRSASLQQMNNLERTDSAESRNSINFSYPRGSRPTSPSPRSPVLPNGGGSEPKKAVNGISSSEATKIQRSLDQTAAKPVKKKKKAERSNEGTYLQSGSVASDNTTQQSGAASQSQSTEELATRKPKKKATLSGQSSHFRESDNDSSIDVQQTPDRRSQRASGLLAKQPSVVREDWEGEQEEPGSPASPASPTFQSGRTNVVAKTVQSKKPLTEANVSRKIEDSSRTVHDSVTTPLPKSVATVKALSPETQTGRQSSISPSRSFRFSDRLASDMTAGRKHEPLPRSVSPAKSALKHHSPAGADASAADNNNTQRRGSSVTPSESSEQSMDGMNKRKKSVRVSFEANPETVEPSSDTDRASRVEKEGGKKGLFGFGKSKGSSSTAIIDDTEEGMKPRPALPSFGSVRKNRSNEVSPSPASRQQDGSGILSPKSPALSDTSSKAEVPTMHTSVSSDHAVGGLIFRESQKRNEPLPPEVTTVEGSGYTSDTDSMSSYSDEEREQRQGSSKQPKARKNIPDIAVQPATPGMDEISRGQGWSSEVPGTFPGSDESSDPSSTGLHAIEAESHNVGTALTNEDDIDDTPSTHGLSDQTSNHLNTIEEEETTDNDSIYSDAAEDLSDLEGDGYGSINAIVESPMMSPSPAARFSAEAESPVVVAKHREKDEQDAGSWDNMQARWSGIAQQTRSQLGHNQDVSENNSPQPQVPVDVATTKASPSLQPPAEIATRPQQKKQKKGVEVAPPAPAVTLATQPPRNQPATAKSPNSPTEADSSAASKRLSATTNPRSLLSSRWSDSEPVPSLRQRPQSMVTAPTQPRAALQKKNAATATAPKPVQRTFSNDSDSDSSFRRERRSRRAANGGAFTMKRSMRGGPSTDARAPTREEQRTARALSPVAQRPTSPFGGSMRMTMRGSQDRAAPTLRSQPDQKRSSSFLGKARRAMSPPPSTKRKVKLPSRFADSDDEDQRIPTTYRSRFAESSDEDEPEPMRPVRGIPKRKDEGDSTDLEDSSDDQKKKTKTKPILKSTLKSTPKKQLAIQVPETSSPVTSEPMSPTTAKKKGFWGRLRGKKEKEASADATIAQRNGINGTNTAVMSGAADQNDSTLGFSSTAERDAIVEATMKKLEMGQGASSSPTPGRLQRRVTPQRVLSDSWPLPPKMPGASNDRPITSDGVGLAGVSRPDLGERQPTSDTLRTAGGTVVYGRTGKKKKFPRLRKAFGLTD